MRRLPETISEELDINLASYESCIHAYPGLNIVLLKSGDEYLDPCLTCDDHLGSAVMCDIAIDTFSEFFLVELGTYETCSCSLLVCLIGQYSTINDLVHPTNNCTITQKKEKLTE
uniref:Uncharacterized protein n=1 Tax=Solanum lycopersicum TaxID=4081 RepID=A0A3Q7IIB1_SOLLC